MLDAAPATPVPATPAPLDLPGLYAALESARAVMALSATDWSRRPKDAWLYGILLGWDGDPAQPDDPGAWQQLAGQHGWDPVTLAKLRRLRTAVAGLTIDAIADLRQQLAAAPGTPPRDELSGELGRMDSKTSMMLGGSIAGVAFGVATLIQTHLPLPAAMLGWLAVGLIAAAMAMLAVAARPQLDGEHGFNRYADADPDDPALLAAETPSERARALVWKARRARAGYRAVRTAIHLLLAALPTAAIAAVVAAVLR